MSVFCASWINEMTLALPNDWTREVPTESVENDDIMLSTTWSSMQTSVMLAAQVSATGDTLAELSTASWNVEVNNPSPSALAAAVRTAAFDPTSDLPAMTTAFLGVALSFMGWDVADYASGSLSMRRWLSPDGSRSIDYIHKDESAPSGFLIIRPSSNRPDVDAFASADEYTPAGVLLNLATSD